MYVSTSDQITDILIKSLGKPKFQNFRDRIGDKALNHAQEICKL
jgi:beta-lactamase class A